MEVDVDDASRRDDPAEIEVEQVHTIQERLIYAWERKGCHSAKLLPEQGANGYDKMTLFTSMQGLARALYKQCNAMSNMRIRIVRKQHVHVWRQYETR